MADDCDGDWLDPVWRRVLPFVIANLPGEAEIHFPILEPWVLGPHCSERLANAA